MGKFIKLTLRRWVIAGLLILGLGLGWVGGCPSLFLGGTFSGQPEDLNQHLSRPAHALLAQALGGVGAEPLVDYHAHIIGIGTGNSQAEVNPALLHGWRPVKRLNTGIFLSACGVSDFSRLDQEYVERLVRLVRGVGHPVKMHILAFDHAYRPDGTINQRLGTFYVPNEYVVQLAEQYPDVFVPVISVHPDRPDALVELEKWAQRGVRYVKWLPNAQGIDPSSPRCDGFYAVMKKYDMVLLTHAGKEKSLDVCSQAFGNPLLLRRPLDQGVKVILAHCASAGRNADLDHPGVQAGNFDLFLRLMETESYRGLLFADISALTQVNRTPQPILELIRRPELHSRLVNGSDYPLPAINCLIWTRKLARMGLITPQERRCLNEIYNYNPLLFDYVLKRTIRDPVTGKQLPVSVFLQNPGIVENPR
jgi:predicted TIM-barrel fold metal-dependent hydrolase